MYVHLETTCHNACECNDRLNGAQYLSEVEPQLFVLSVVTGNEGALYSLLWCFEPLFVSHVTYFSGNVRVCLRRRTFHPLTPLCR
jgi:hypothetical protein